MPIPRTKTERPLRERIEVLFKNNPTKTYRVTDISVAMFKTPGKRSTVQYHLNHLKNEGIINQNADEAYVLAAKEDKQKYKDVVRKVFEQESVDQDELKALIIDLYGKECDDKKILFLLLNSHYLEIFQGNLQEGKYKVHLGFLGANILDICPYCNDSLASRGEGIVLSSTYTEDPIKKLYREEIKVFAHTRCIVRDLWPCSYHNWEETARCSFCQLPLSTDDLLRHFISDCENDNLILRFLDPFEYDVYIKSLSDNPDEKLDPPNKVIYRYFANFMLKLREYANNVLKLEYRKEDYQIWDRINTIFKFCYEHDLIVQKENASKERFIIQEYFGHSAVIKLGVPPHSVFNPEDLYYGTIQLLSSQICDIRRDGNDYFHPVCYEKHLKTKKDVKGFAEES